MCTEISFVKFKHYSLFTLNEYPNFIGVSLPQTLTYLEMIERITVHLEKKKEERKKKVLKNPKLILLIKAIPNLRVFMSLIKILFLHQTVLINVL